MALTKFGFIVTGFDPAQRITMASGSFKTIVAGVKDVAHAPAAANAMVEEGVQLIELCGAFGAVGTAAVIEAVGGRIPVGFVGYGPEAITPMHRLFA